MSSRTIQAVLFDYGMVLSGPPNTTAWEAMRSQLDLTEQRFRELYWKYRDDYDRGTISGVEYWRSILEDAGCAPSDSLIRALIGHDLDLWTDVNTPMVDWAERLQRAGIRTGILSNIGDEMAEGICQKFAWITGFTSCVWSHSLKLRKPEPAIYLHAAELLGLPTGQIVFIDDREENIAAAEAIGMLGILYKTHGTFEQAMRAAGLASLLAI